MASKTPLRIFAELMAERKSVPVPADIRIRSADEAQALRRFLDTLQKNRREREVAEYLIRASSGGGHRDTGAGSLKHLLWLLRDRAGEHYEPLAKHLLSLVLDRPDLPLGGRLADALLYDPVLGMWARMVMEGFPVEELAARMEFMKAGRWVIALNRTSLNLLKVAAARGVSLYVASSEQGAVIKAIRESGFPLHLLRQIAQEAGGKWTMPYPDMIRWANPEEAPSADRLMDAISRVLR